MDKLLELQGVAKSYSSVTVLHDINMNLNAGEILGIIGENGAGKSTLIKIISGAISADKGSVTYFGKKYDKLNPRQIMDLGIATIYQEIDLVDNLTVADNIFLGTEIRNKFGLIDEQEEIKQVNDLLNRMKLSHINSRTMLSELSTAQKQCVQIVKALKNDAKILILDEPTASLGDQESRILIELVKHLASRGMGVIYISHFIDEVFEICNRLLILKDGVQISICDTRDTDQDSVIHAMIGRNAANYYKREYFPRGKRVLRIEHYKNKHTVHDVSLKIMSGEIFGLGGLVGAGRTELIRMIYGAEPKISGELYLEDQKITPLSPRDAIKKGIYMISENRKGEGLLLTRPIRENISITHNENNEWINLAEENRTISKEVKDYEIKIHSVEDDVASLSGGNQQKTIIARCMIDIGDVYIFDEPTKGVDIGAKEDIYKHILNLAKQDKFVIIISSDMPELLSMSDRIGVMCDGRLVDIVDAQKASEDSLMRKYLDMTEKDTAEA